MVIFSLKPGRPLWVEIGYQFLHMGYSGILWILILLPIPAWGAGVLSFVGGIVRELEQHNWDWRALGRQDLFFWGLASLLLTVIFYAA
ncbi:hypothetical protein [Nitrosospira sp. NpAV]|uniref:hypothetical protein n=1 Tax=Nitrosospira sp. NpAV TaxID=58133 RepID=UPI00059F1606|nr:hypothetical protein [Nitrosospira sp. NpAV]KIO49587.1 hypothetical protein SQ11_05505 [Nitrosospira sp. NpAV]